MAEQFQIVNADPRLWPNWEKLLHERAERLLAREAFLRGEYADYLNKQNCTPAELQERLNFLAFIWKD